MDWDVFISYASEDRDDVAVPLFGAMVAHGLRVWLDRQELRIGDSLRGKIDFGLARSRFGVVVLSVDSLEKRWPMLELGALLALEREDVKVILPVWHGIGLSDLARRSPLLADRIAGDTADGVAEVAAAIADVVLGESGACR